MLYFFLIGMVLWMIAFFITTNMQKEFNKIKNKDSIDRDSFLSITICFSLFIVVLVFIFLGFLLNLSAMLMLIIQLSDAIFSGFSPGTIEYKDFLSIFVQIISLFGTVTIAAAAYLFKKKS